jgi:ABC-type branched-subunit amino acid transport system ATPase component
MTVMENMLLAAPGQLGESLSNLVFRAAAIREQERVWLDKARGILAVVKLSGKADDLAGELSGGQRKLLSLGQALMAEPRLILLDEPVAGVNPLLVEEIAEVIRRLCQEGRNFLIVEHNMAFVRRTCDRISALDAGAVIAEGTPAEVLSRDDVLRAYLGRRAGGPDAGAHR